MSRNAQRPHRPHDLGPRIFARGRWLAADCRPWGGERITIRNPDHPQWPAKGDRTEDAEVANRWKWAYVDRLRGAVRRKHLKLPGDAKRVDVAIDEYLAHRASTVEPFTARNDHTALTVHLLAVPGADRGSVADVTTEQIQRYFNTLAADYARGTLTTYRTTLLAFFQWAGRTGDDNPARGVQLREAGTTDARAWTDDELRALRTAADRLDRQRHRDRKWPDSFRRCLEAGVGVGGRFRELGALEWPRFRGDRTVRFNVQLDERGSGVKPLKGNRNRTTLVLPSFYAYMGRGKWPTSGHVLTPNPLAGFFLVYAEKWMEYLYEIAGMRGRWSRWHTLRHTYSRVFLESGGSLEQLQKSLGHESIKTTESTYAHFTHDSAAELARMRIYGESRGRHGTVSGTSST